MASIIHSWSVGPDLVLAKRSIFEGAVFGSFRGSAAEIYELDTVTSIGLLGYSAKCGSLMVVLRDAGNVP
ncbi:hypothetical protein M413DRAFT_448228 [Hebeloma cylindrosporum]|uniref:Uncharacterized protein n=1 Tax=Hebeloma cylindrosporum TaxID=76867 RepID=A0A0C3C254_HEBCY|nr:hypothetical protein M413DRAFT_448228 [Hebeloma cylindrosporum h7]